MIGRPSEQWRRAVRDQAAEVAAGTLTEDEAYAARLWPEEFITAVDAALKNYEENVRALRSPSDDEIFTAVESVVQALNTIDEEHGAIETGEREQLAEYVDDVLTTAGIDVDAFTSRRGIHRLELTDAWRDW